MSIDTAPPGDPAPPAPPSGSRLAQNTVFSGVGEASNGLLFLLGFLAARYLAPSAFGSYSAALAFVAVFRILPDFGMAYASTLDISRDRSRAARLVGGLLGFQAVLSCATLALCLGLGYWVFARAGDRLTWTCVLLLGADLVLKTVKTTLRWLLKGLQSFGTEAVSLVAERALLLAVGFLVLREGGGAAAFVLVFVAVRIPDLAGLFAYIHTRIVPLRPAYDPGLWGELFRKGLPFAYTGIAITLFFQVDQVLLERMRTPQEAGWYSAPVRILEGLTLVPRILGYALIPTMAALHPSSPARVIGLYRRGIKYLLLFGLPVAAFGLLCADPLIPLLFGRAYGPSISAARILLPTAAFLFVSNFSETTLFCVNRWRTIVAVSTVCLALNVLLNLLFIPAHGFEGAAFARLATEAAYAALLARGVARYEPGSGWATISVRPVLAAAVFAWVLWGCRGLPLAAAASLAALAWAAAALGLGVLDAPEREALRRAFRRPA